MSNNLYSIKQGEKYDISICIRDRDNDTPIDLTNAVIHFQLKDELKDEFFVVDKTITLNSDPFTDGRIVDPKEGRFTTRFTNEDYEFRANAGYNRNILWIHLPCAGSDHTDERA